MAPKAEGPRYSQERRDAEAAAVKEAQALVPPKYLEAVKAEADGRNNPTTKLLKGVIAYLNEMGSGPSVQSMQQQSNSPTGPMAADAPPWLKGDAGLRALQQAMIRLIQCIQTRAMAEGGLSDDMKEIINQTNDALVDVIEKVERRST